MSAGTIAVARDTSQRILDAVDESLRTQLAIGDLCELRDAADQLDDCMGSLVRAIGLMVGEKNQLFAIKTQLTALLNPRSLTTKVRAPQARVGGFVSG